MELEKNKISDNININESFQDYWVKDSVESLIKLSDEDALKKHFISLWYEDYLDFYYLNINHFRDILLSDKRYKDLFVKITLEQITKITIKWKLKFIEFLWFERINYDNFKEILLNDLSDIWIDSLNDLRVHSLNKFIEWNKDNKYFRYFIERMFSKSITYIDYEEYFIMADKLWLKLISWNEQISLIKNILSTNYNINYLEDLDNISIKWFRKICDNESIILDYFKNTLWIEKTSILKDDISKFWEHLWLKNNIFDKWEYLNSFLKKHQISSYDDILSFWIKWAREILWWDTVIRNILEWFWIKYAKDFRLDHIKRFCRFVWLEWIPEKLNKDEEKSKNLISNILQNKNITCLYSLELNWIKPFKRLFRLDKLWPVVHNNINYFIKNNLWTSLSKLEYKDLLILGKLIWFEYKTEQEHKKDMLDFLEKNWTDIDKLNISKIRKNKLFWTNPSIRYFLNEIWATNDVKDLKVIHAISLKEYVSKI